MKTILALLLLASAAAPVARAQNYGGTNCTLMTADDNTLYDLVSTVLKVSPGTTTGKTEVHRTFTAHTAAAGLSILGSYVVTSGKTLYLTHMDFTARESAISATGANLGNIQVATPAGTGVSSMTFVNPTTSQPMVWARDFSEPWAVPSATVLMSSVSASVATATDWVWNFDGYEK